MSNLYNIFSDLIPKTPLLLVTIVQVNTDGTSIVRTFDNNNFRVLGTSITVGKPAYIQDGKIVSEGPDLNVRAIQYI